MNRFHSGGARAALRVALFVALALAFTPAGASCGAAFCLVNTNWDVQGIWVEPGARVDVRFEFIDQNQPLAGSQKVSVGQIPQHHNEVETINRNWLFNADYVFDRNWGVGATVPVIDRSHEHIHVHHGQQLVESWDFTRIGDVRLLGRYQFDAVMTGEPTEPGMYVFGINFGVKLPTGSYDVKNSQGIPAERSLQPGTGTTDALVGGYFRQSIAATRFGWFAQALFAAALDSRDGYKPGNRFNVDLGVRYEVSEQLALLLQLNGLYRGRDSGSEAEPEDSGGRYLFLTPGVSYALTGNVQVYAFYQQSLYQYVNGVQLTAPWSATAGVAARF